MSTGLRDEDFAYIRAVIARFPGVERAVLFGSRAMGNWKPGSDIDIAIYGAVDFSLAASLQVQLADEGPMPYLVDIVDYAHCESIPLREHIDRYGVEIYRRQ